MNLQRLSRLPGAQDKSLKLEANFPSSNSNSETEKFPELKFKLRNRQISWAQIQTPDLNYLKILNVENQKLKSTVPVSKFVNPKIAKIKRVKTWKYQKLIAIESKTSYFTSAITIINLNCKNLNQNQVNSCDNIQIVLYSILVHRNYRCEQSWNFQWIYCEYCEAIACIASKKGKPKIQTLWTILCLNHITLCK